MRCPKCGRSTSEQYRYCSSCGFDFQGVGFQGQQLSQPQKSKSEKDNSMLVVAVVVIVVVIVAIGIIAVAFLAKDVSDDGSSDGSDDVQLKGIVLVVNSAYESYAGWLLEDGNKYVIYSVTVTNYKSSEMDFWEYAFELHTTDGLVYDPSYTAGTTMSTPDEIESGGSYTFDLGYEIRSSDSGDRIVYEWWFDHASVDVPL